MTLQEALTLTKGTTVYSLVGKNADGTAMRMTVTSVKTWKTRPEKVQVTVKRGLYEFGMFDETILDKFSTTEPTV